MPAPFSTPTPGGLGGVFASLGAVAGPLAMVIMAARNPGPVTTLLKAGADSPESARKPETLGVKEPPLKPLIRAGVVVREDDGRVWVDRAKAKRRQVRIALTFAAAGVLVGLAVWAVMRM
jgi:hypothetical protein